MYQAPDFVKVNVNVKDVFATYGCPMSEGTIAVFQAPCNPGDPYYSETGWQTYVGLDWGTTCYVVELP